MRARSLVTGLLVVAAHALLAACGAPASAPAAPATTDRLVGEVTVHQFADWTHAWAVFVDPAVAVADVREGAILLPPALDALALPPAGPLHFVWTPGEAELIEVLLAVSSDLDPTQSVRIRCLAPDTGAFDLAAAALARAPSAPRTVHLEITRNADHT